MDDNIIILKYHCTPKVIFKNVFLLLTLSLVPVAFMIFCIKITDSYVYTAIGAFFAIPCVLLSIILAYSFIVTAKRGVLTVRQDECKFCFDNILVIGGNTFLPKIVKKLNANHKDITKVYLNPAPTVFEEDSITFVLGKEKLTISTSFDNYYKLKNYVIEEFKEKIFLPPVLGFDEPAVDAHH